MHPNHRRAGPLAVLLTVVALGLAGCGANPGVRDDPSIYPPNEPGTFFPPLPVVGY